MVESVALDTRIRLPYNRVKAVLDLVFRLDYLRHFVSRVKDKEVGISPNNSVLPVPSEQKLQTILEDPEWKEIRTLNQREALVIKFLGGLGYRSISELYNPRGRHAIFYGSAFVASIDILNGTYTPANGSVPSDIEGILKKADFKYKKP